MKERFKTKLTRDIILEDFESSRESSSGTGKKLALVLALIAALGILCDPAGVLVPAVILLALAAVLFITSLRIPGAGSKVNVEILEDCVVGKCVKRRNHTKLYCLNFKKSGELLAEKQDQGTRYKAVYSKVEYKEDFYVVKANVGWHRSVLLYSRNLWRREDVTQEQIEQEIREEEDLIRRVMDCERFPRLTVRENHFPKESVSDYPDILNKPEAERSLLERLAAGHFGCDRISAMEYILRYCPEGLQREAIRELTGKEAGLCRRVSDCIRKEK